MSLHAVIMAGGSGTRFWPASRKHRPKQFLPLAGGTSLLQATVDRVRELAGDQRTWIVTNEVQAAAIPDVVPGFDPSRILVEPEPRDTAPCIAFAAAHIGATDANATLAVMPADHVIRPVDAFTTLLRRGAALAADGETLVTFGIAPTRPATEYGYIEAGVALDDLTPPAHRASRFREKPERAVAEEFVASDRFLWNSGIFVWSLAALRRAMAIGSEELAACATEMADAARAGDAERLAAAFARAPKQSIDYAVMEKAPQVAVVRADLEWFDLGSFLTLDAVSPSDVTGNVQALHAGAEMLAIDSERCVTYAEGDRTVVLFGVRDIVVVAVDDVVLVCPKDRADHLKEVVQRIRDSRGERLL